MSDQKLVTFGNLVAQLEYPGDVIPDVDSLHRALLAEVVRRNAYIYHFDFVQFVTGCERINLEEVTDIEHTFILQECHRYLHPTLTTQEILRRIRGHLKNATSITHMSMVLSLKYANGLWLMSNVLSFSPKNVVDPITPTLWYGNDTYTPNIPEAKYVPYPLKEQYSSEIPLFHDDALSKELAPRIDEIELNISSVFASLEFITNPPSKASPTFNIRINVRAVPFAIHRRYPSQHIHTISLEECLVDVTMSDGSPLDTHLKTVPWVQEWIRDAVSIELSADPTTWDVNLSLVTRSSSEKPPNAIVGISPIGFTLSEFNLIL